MDDRNCYSCSHCTRDLYDYATWCSVTGKTIDDGFGYGDCEPCNRYSQSRKLYAFSFSVNDDPLPF